MFMQFQKKRVRTRRLSKVCGFLINGGQIKFDSEVRLRNFYSHNSTIFIEINEN